MGELNKNLIDKFYQFLENKNFSYTLASKLTDIGFKFIILIVLMALGSTYVVEYTYFLSLSAILSVVIDFGTSRENVRFFNKTKKLKLNFHCLTIAFLVFFSIRYVFDFKFYNNTFLILCISLSFINAWKNTFIKYFEFINNNMTFYKIQTIVNIVSFSIILGILFLSKNLTYVYVMLVLSNMIILLVMFSKTKNSIVFSAKIISLVKGVPFLLNSIASMAFSQISVVILNQFSSPLEIANFVIAQRLMDLSLMISNSFTSSEIGKFFKGTLDINIIRKKAFYYWVILFVLLLPICYFIKYFNETYTLVLVMYLFLLPIGLVKSITPTYSIVMDYTKYYYLRTIVIGVILLANILFSRFVYNYSDSIYHFILFIDFLIVSLLVFYYISFNKLKIYENYHN